MINHELPVNLLEKLSKMSEKFYLTGSRYFGQFNPRFSDYDYFTLHSDELVKNLTIMGFSCLTGKTYKDSNCVLVMRAFSQYGQIDIQLVSSVEKKARIQEIFKQNQILSPTKEQWNLAYMVS